MDSWGEDSENRNRPCASTLLGEKVGSWSLLLQAYPQRRMGVSDSHSLVTLAMKTSVSLPWLWIQTPQTPSCFTFDFSCSLPVERMGWSAFAVIAHRILINWPLMYLRNLGILNQGPWYSFPTTFTSICRAQSHPDSITKLWCREQDSGGRDLPAQGPCLRTISQPHKNTFTSIFQLWWAGCWQSILHLSFQWKKKKKKESIGMAGLLRTNLSPKLQKFTQPKCVTALKWRWDSIPGGNPLPKRLKIRA